MSDDYAKGFSGQARDSDTHEGEYRRGVEDREAGRAASGMGAMDLSGVRAESVVIAGEWARHPDRTLFKMLFGLVWDSAKFGAIGFVVAMLIQAFLLRYPTDDSYLLSSLNWALKIGGFVFFLGGVLTAARIAGSMTHKFTLLGLVAFLALTGGLIYIVWWLYALSAGIVTSPTWMR